MTVANNKIVVNMPPAPQEQSMANPTNQAKWYRPSYEEHVRRWLEVEQQQSFIFSEITALYLDMPLWVVAQLPFAPLLIQKVNQLHQERSLK